MTKKVDRRLSSAISSAIGTRARKVERIPGFLGAFVDGEKTVRVPGREDFVFVRLRMDRSETIQAFNDQVGDQFGIPVTVIRDESAPRFYRVISREIDTFQDWGSPYLVNHAEQHMFAGGTGTVASDVVWVYRRAFVPLGVSPNGTMTANVASDYYIWDNIVKHFGPTGTVDFSSVRDSLGVFEARFVTVFLNGDTSELNYLTGEIFDNTVVVTDPTEFISVPGSNEGIPLAAIYLFNSMTQVLWKDIFDIRQIIQSVGGSGGGSGVNWANVIIVAVSGGDHTTITAALAEASAGDVILVMPGTYVESITLVAGVTVVGIANSTGPVIIAPAAGTVVTIPSGAGTYRLHNCTLTPPSSTATVTDNMGAAGLATLYRVNIGSSGGGDSIDSSGGNASATLTIEECRLTGDFLQFSICDFIDSISSSEISPVASAGDLTIYGGEVLSGITHVSGQTVAYLNTPFIGGTVSGSATEFGSYMAGTNELRVINNLIVGNDIDITDGALLVAGTERINNSGGALFTSIIDTALTTGRVIFATTNGELTDDADFTFDGSQLALAVQGSSGGVLLGGDAQLYRNAANELRTPDTLVVDGNLGIGLVSPTADVHIQRSGSLASVDVERYGGAPSFVFKAAGGTLATPTAVSANGNLGRFNAFGHDATDFDASSNVAVFFKASENFSVGNHGTYMTFEVTPDGSTTRAEKMRLTNDGRLGVLSNAPAGQTHIDQSSATGAIPVLFLDQADLSEEMIQFATTIGTGNPIEAVGAKTLTTTHFIKVTLPGSLTRYIPVGTIA